jgi:hypothetical protein
MIRKLLFALLLSLPLASFAQIPNYGFNSWTNQNPNSWATANLIMSFGNPQSAFRDTIIVKEGVASIRIETVKLVNNIFAPDLPDTVGIAFTGNITFSGLAPGFPYAARPSELAFAYQYAPSSGDTAWASVVLQKWNTSTNMRDTVATGFWFTTGTTSSWTMPTIPLVYNATNPTAYPDTAIILFSSSSYFSPKIGSKLWVDDLAWYGWSGIDAMGIPGEGVTPYPNPASDAISFSVVMPGAATISIFDVTGRMLDAAAITGRTASISTASYAAGVYTYSVLDSNGNVISRGKFNIAR